MDNSGGRGCLDPGALLTVVVKMAVFGELPLEVLE